MATGNGAISFTTTTNCCSIRKFHHLSHVSVFSICKAAFTMTTNCCSIRKFHHLSHVSVFSICKAACPVLLKGTRFPFRPASYVRMRRRFNAISVSSGSGVGSSGLTWDDVLRAGESNHGDSSDLQGFFEKVKLCNRNSEKQNEFMPFVIEGHVVGYVHYGFADHLRKFGDVFIFPKSEAFGSKFGCHVTLHSMLRTAEDRTRAVGDVVKSLGEELIPGIRNELYPVTSSFGCPIFFSVERAAAPYFGTKAYGIHMNGYVEKDGQKYLWLAKRSKLKPTYPGMLDHLVAGGLPHDISCEKNVEKECKEEAGIPSSISCKAIPVGAVSYMDIDGYRFKRDVLFCYDLKLPEGFVPNNEDGEVESFKLVPITHVANVIRNTEFVKANCNLVIIDFLFRHGYIKPESFAYLKLLQSLRSGDCS